MLSPPPPAPAHLSHPRSSPPQQEAGERRALDLLFLTQTYPRHPGDIAGPFIQELARALVRGGDRVTVLAPHCTGLAAAAWEEEGVEVETFRYAPEGRELLGYGRSLAADERVKGGAALVAPLYAWGARRALARRLARRRYDLVHAHWIVPNGIIAAAAAGGQGGPGAPASARRGSRAARMGRSTPLAIGLHGSDVFLAEKRALRAAVRWALRRTLLLTGCSPELVARVGAMGFPAERSRVIPYGVDTAVFSPDPERRPLWRARLGVPAAAPLLLGVGRMATKKGFGVLLEALPRVLAAVPELHVALAGGGDLLTALRAAAGRLGGRIHLPGPVERGALPDLYRAADLFVLPALHDAGGNVDGLPNVILEAMASGLPVVASGISGIPLAVEDEVTGLLVPERDAGALAAALLALLADPDAARRMGERGREKARAELTWEVIAARHHQAYAEALAAGWTGGEGGDRPLSPAPRSPIYSPSLSRRE